MSKLTKYIGRIFTALSLLFLLWVFVSWVDIVADNSRPNPVHSDYNIFVILFEKSPE